MKNRWIDVDKQLPSDRKNILGFDGKRMYICRYVREHQEDTEIDDYDEYEERYSKDIENDTEREVFWLRPGFWETIEQYSCAYDYTEVRRHITHWQRLPLKPQEYESQRLTTGH